MQDEAGDAAMSSQYSDPEPVIYAHKGLDPREYAEDDEEVEEEEAKQQLKEQEDATKLQESSRDNAAGPAEPTRPRARTASGLMGITDDNERFILPKTSNPLTLHPISKWTFFDWLKNACLLHFLLLLFGLPRWFFVVSFLFWRLAYNVGIGLLLYQQSKSNLLTRFVRSIKPDSPLYGAIKFFISSGMDTDFQYEKFPAAFNAWMGFRHIVDVVLANDLISYIVFVLACVEVPETFTFKLFFSYLFGIFLCAFTLWAKTDAYRVVKDFAWYWGDFFFLVDQKLTFDRVFSISPHPMYTIGYGFYYGSALLTQSSVVLYVSLVAHFCQIAFLTFVENPHIEKTYPFMVEDPEQVKDRQAILSGYFRRDLIVLKNFFILRSADLFTLIIVLYTIVLNLLPLPPLFYIGMVLLWRCIHSFVLGGVLFLQSKNGWWTNRFLKRGESKQVAFESWKSIYNLSLVMNHVAFLCCFLKFAVFNYDLFGRFFFSQAGAVILIFVNVWSSVSVYEVLGEFGWFYGDFFIDEVPSSLYYTGIYRFLNNPDIVTGFAAYYGLALISDSWVVFALAMFSQLAHYIFVRYVERAHMRKLYGNRIRIQSGVNRAIKEIMSEVVESSPPLKKISQLATKSVNEVEMKVSEYRQKAEEYRLKAEEVSRSIKGKVVQQIKENVDNLNRNISIQKKQS